MATDSTSSVQITADLQQPLRELSERTTKSAAQIVDAALRAYLGGQQSSIGNNRLQLAEQTLNSIVAAVLTVDRHTGIESMNPSAEELMGWQLAEVVNEPVAQVLKVYAEEHAEVAVDLVQQCLQEGESIEIPDDAVLETRSGHRMHITGVASPLRNSSGNIVGAAVVLRDITQHKRLAAELRKQRNNLERLVERRTADLRSLQAELLKKERLATLGHLTASVGHELRNPLGTIQNTMYLVDKKVRTEMAEMTPQLDRIARNIVRCNRIIQGLLDFAHVRGVHCSPVEIDPWITSLLDEFEVPVGIEVVRDLACPVAAPIDADRLRRAMINLYDNACQAMLEDSGLKTRVLTVRTSKEANTIRIAVEDTGPGMKPSVKSKIFEALFSTKRFGVGLGLPIVRQIISQHHGHLDLQSEPGCGSRFTIQLPITVTPENRDRGAR